MYPRLQDGTDGAWRWNRQKVEQDGWRIEWVKSNAEWTPYFRIYADMSKGRPPETIFPHKDVGSNRTSRKQVKDIFPEGEVFSTPKPTGLLKKIISIVADEDSLILDSFAGSGTTAHAVLELNKEDGGNRKFILVQQPFDNKKDEEKKLNITQRITAQRVRRVIKGYQYGTKRKPMKVSGLGGDFSYCELGPSLFTEYRDLGKRLPGYDELAKYIFYTETSSDFDKKGLNAKTGKIGEYRKTSYYLLYTPNNKEDQALDLKWLKSIEKSEKNRNLVVYCEKIWIHRDDLAKYEKETGRKVRPMIVPFNLK